MMLTINTHRSMNDLAALEPSDEDVSPTAPKETGGFLRRAFSSKKKKKKRNLSPGRPTPGFLTPPPPCYFKQPLRATRSNPDAPVCVGCLESSSASDLAARRGVFSRRHYGSVEMLTSTDSDGCENAVGRFRVETGERDLDETCSPVSSPVHLENPESQTRWYFKYFLGKMHQNYVGTDAEREPFLLSVVVTDANNHSVPQYRAILWRRTGSQKLCLPYNPNKPMTVKSILGHFGIEKIERGPKEIYNPDVQRELLVLEEQEGSVNFKFGVLFCKEGQTGDDEMYGNEFPSAEFERFTRLLGEEVNLKGWEKYKGGLDVKGNTTGTHSIYTVYEGHEIMFHISTMLPYSKDNKQQVERKRHVGNDIVNIVFVECDSNRVPSFRPSMMKTHFTHIFAVVTYNADCDSYRLNVFSAESVPLFGPPLPCPPVFSNHQEFRDFLLVKLINGEKAAFNTPVFAQKRERTLEMLIQNLAQNHLPENSKNNMLTRRAFSDIVPDNMYGTRRKEEARQAEFLRIGQSLKLKTILRGDAPTSLITSGALLKHQPWEPQCFLHDFHHDVICGDSWGDKLIVATETDTYMLEDGAPPRSIFDKTVIVKQLNVVEAHGIMVLRTEKGKEGWILVFHLLDFEGEKNEDFVRSKNECKDHRLEQTKGCHLYALSRPSGSHLRMVVAIGKRLLVAHWKHSAAWSAWCNPMASDPVDGFQFLREIQAFDVPQLMTLVDGPKGDNQICIAYKNQFDLINEQNGDTLQLYQVDSNKVNFVAALDIYEDDEPELLLCYNYSSHFQKLKEETSHEFDFNWTSEPRAIVCAFPYILAFTPDAIEVRLIINGSLVHSMAMPRLRHITSKCDIFFASTATDQCGSPLDKGKDGGVHSPPPSPGATSTVPVSLYKIPLTCLVGQINADKSLHGPPPSQPHSMLSPLVNPSEVADPDPRLRSVRMGVTRRSGPVIQLPRDELKVRHDSNSSSCDSGIHLNRTSDITPPVSPSYILRVQEHVDEDDEGFV